LFPIPGTFILRYTPEWKTISHARLWSATARAMGEYRSEEDSGTEKNKTGADDAPESEE